MKNELVVKNIASALVDAKPEYKIYAELLVGSSRLFIVLDAPITSKNNETAIKIGNLLWSGT